MAAITRDETRDRFDKIIVWTRGEQRAPHKPLLLLLTLSGIVKGLPRLTAFADLESPMKDLLEKYGPPRKSHHPEYPFWRLQADGIWEVPNSDVLIRRRGNSDPLRSELITKNAKGGFTNDIHELFLKDAKFVREIAQAIAVAHFPPDVRASLLSELGLVGEGLD